MPMSISRNAQLLKYFAQQCHGMPSKHLVKMAYMADLLARQFLGHPISGFNYVVFYHGPYPHEFKDAIGELEAAGLAQLIERKKADPSDYELKKLFDAGKAVSFDFDLGENEVLAHVVRTFLNMDTEEFVEDVVYPTRPFQIAKEARRLDEPIPMHIVDGEGRREIGFDLNKALEAERQAEEGQFMTAASYFNGLRNRIAARHAN